ncbi:MAG TPA: hypothetical protein PLL75_02680 [Candidatus Omnitrophota bacterium]|nr:hypothetical protein [Candidatus Omnitrophota bacterium]HPS36617.1 hypothetical protein [Candidatus Omnitrophota bacterium]
MKKAKVLLALAACAFLLVPQGLAKDVWEMAQSDVYKEKSGGMLGRGFVNALTSPVDIFVQTVDKSKKGPALVGTLTGMAGGLGCTALRASSGIVDVAFFWVPGFNGFPVAKSYENCLEDDTEVVEPIQAPVVQQPIVPVVTPAEPQKPLVTVVEDQPAPTPKKVVRDPYRYVKK